MCRYNFKLKRKHTLKSSALKIKASGWLLFFSSFLFSFLFLLFTTFGVSVYAFSNVDRLYFAILLLFFAIKIRHANHQHSMLFGVVNCMHFYIYTYMYSTHTAYIVHAQPHIMHTCTERTWKNSREQAATEAIVIAEGNWHCKSSCGQCIFVRYLIANVYHHHTQPAFVVSWLLFLSSSSSSFFISLLLLLLQ